MHLFAYPGRLFAASRIAKKAIDGVEPWAGHQPFLTDVLVFPHEGTEELRLQAIAGRKRGVTAFGGKRTVRGATPIEASFPQTGAGSDEGDEGLRPRVGHHAWLSAIRRQRCLVRGPSPHPAQAERALPGTGQEVLQRDPPHPLLLP